MAAFLLASCVESAMTAGGSPMPDGGADAGAPFAR